MNVFVFHAQDSQGCALAALVRYCDVELRFQYLPVETPDSVRRMHRFLQQQGLSADIVGLPFVVTVQPSPSNVVTRSVLHGAPFIQWIDSLINAVMQTPISPAPPQLCEMVLAPFLPHTLRLLAYTMGLVAPITTTTTDNNEHHAVVVSPPTPPPPLSANNGSELVNDRRGKIATGAGVMKKGSSMQENQQQSKGSPDDSDMEEDDDAEMMWSNVDKSSLPRRNRESTVNIAQVMMESKTREKMNPPNRRT